MSSPLHKPVVDQQGRLTISLIDDNSIVIASTGSTSPLTYVSRLQTQDADNTTKVTQVVEIGTNGIVGGVADLAEFKGKLSRQDVNCALIGLVTGKPQNATPGTTTTWGYFDFSNAKFDYCRLMADSAGAVYASWVALSCVLSGAQFDTKNTGVATEAYDCMGPQLVYMNMIPVSKHYIAQSVDVTGNNIQVGTTFGSGEVPNLVSYLPAPGTPPTALYSTGRINMLNIKRTLVNGATINGVAYSAGSTVRYREYQNYMGACAGAASPGSLTFTMKPGRDIYRDGSTIPNRVGPEITVGSTVIVDAGTPSATEERCTVTAIGSGTITITTTKAHALTDVCIALNPPSGYCVYNPTNNKICVSAADPVVLNEGWRVLFGSDASVSVPVTVGTTSPDTTSLPGVPGRLTPVTISAFQIPRVQSASIKVTIDRKQVQGCGEDEIVYGTAGVPKIDYSLDVLKTDNELLSLLTSNQQVMNATTTGDVFSMDYIVKYGLANAQPIVVSIKNPNANGVVIKSYTGNQPVWSSFGDSGSVESELTQKLTGQDYSGIITVSATT